MDKVKKYAPLATAVIGVLALLFFLIGPAVTDKLIGNVYYSRWAIVHHSGWDVLFGNETFNLDGAFICVLPILFLLGGAVCSVFSFLKPNQKAFSFAALGCFVAAILFLFCTKAFFCNAHEIDKEVAKQYYNLGVGAIIAAVLSILGAITAAIPVILKK